jgi:hypothetical protein
VAVEKTQAQKNAEKNFALACPTNDDLNSLDIFYPQIFTRFEQNWTFQQPLPITLIEDGLERNHSEVFAVDDERD